jgi:glutamine amidotransferase
MTVAIIKYNAGNTESVMNAMKRLGVTATLTDDPIELACAERVIFPGVGEASSAMSFLKERGLDDVIRGLRQPVLGICLGMQLLCRDSEENATDCLGIVNNRVRRFTSDFLKVPHIGWNRITNLRSRLFQRVADGEYVYFVHGYYVEPGAETVATCTYAGAFSAAVEKDNFYAVQFHPEKSGAVGERILRNFLEV